MPENANEHNTMTTFFRFFSEKKERFLSYAFSYVRNRADAEDIVMESVVSLWENREKYDAHANYHALLLTIIKNKALNYLAHLQVRFQAEETINDHQLRELNLRISTLEATNPDSIFDVELQHLLDEALNKLPDKSRQVFVLSRYHETPNKKIAEQLDISVKTVEFHITKALKFLREELKDYLFWLLFLIGY